jgi:hypothetical protein
MKRGYAALAIVGAVAAVAVLALSQTSYSEQSINLKQLDSKYNKYLARHNKSYKSKEEYELRKTLYNKAVESLVEHNSNPENTWTKAIN